jgi:hypothetical protein
MGECREVGWEVEFIGRFWGKDNWGGFDLMVIFNHGSIEHPAFNWETYSDVFGAVDAYAEIGISCNKHFIALV